MNNSGHTQHWISKAEDKIKELNMLLMNLKTNYCTPEDFARDIYQLGKGLQNIAFESNPEIINTSEAISRKAKQISLERALNSCMQDGLTKKEMKMYLSRLEMILKFNHLIS